MLTLGECWQLYSKTWGCAICDAKVYTSFYSGAFPYMSTYEIFTGWFKLALIRHTVSVTFIYWLAAMIAAVIAPHCITHTSL